jgi:CRISPR-associated protein Cas2
VYLIAYDVADDRRRARVFRALKGRGTAVQFSVFRCKLSPAEKLALRSELWSALNRESDRLLLIDLGPADGWGDERWETWGRPIGDAADFPGPQVV